MLKKTLNKIMVQNRYLLKREKGKFAWSNGNSDEDLVGTMFMVWGVLGKQADC